MLNLGFFLVLAATSQQPTGEPAADAVTLQDGRAVLGLVERSSGEGPVVMVVRREWARKQFPDLYPAWVEAEKPAIERGHIQRRINLESWKQDREAARTFDDRLLRWINRELTRLNAAGEPNTRLIRLTLPRDQVKSIARRPESTRRLVRAGWSDDFEAPESMTAAELTEELKARELDPAREPARSVASMLPPYPELDNDWRARRAATEVLFEPALRYVESGAALIPDPSGRPTGGAKPRGVPIPPAFGERDLNPIIERILGEIADRGRIGAAITLRMPGPDPDAATFETTLWVRRATGRWVRGPSTAATVRVADLMDEDRRALENLGQSQSTVRSSRRVVINGKVVEDTTQTRQTTNIGDHAAAILKATARSWDLFRDELAKLALEAD